MSTFRSQAPQPAPETLGEMKTQPVQAQVKVEVPYLDYEHEHGTPYLVTHYDLGEINRGNYSEELGEIEGYLREQVETGEIPNSLSAIKSRLKEIEKVTNMDYEQAMLMLKDIFYKEAND